MWNLKYLTWSWQNWAFFWDTLYPASHKRWQKISVPLRHFQWLVASRRSFARPLTYCKSEQPASSVGDAHISDARAVLKTAEELCGRWIQVNFCCPLTGGPTIGKQRRVGSQVPTGYRRTYVLSPNMRSRLLLLISGPKKCTGLESPGAKSLLFDWLFRDLALGSNYWCLAFGLAVKGYSKQIGKFSRFHSLRACFWNGL
jgi:hypothetical protein